MRFRLKGAPLASLKEPFEEQLLPRGVEAEVAPGEGSARPMTTAGDGYLSPQEIQLQQSAMGTLPSSKSQQVTF